MEYILDNYPVAPERPPKQTRQTYDFGTANATLEYAYQLLHESRQQLHNLQQQRQEIVEDSLDLDDESDEDEEFSVSEYLRAIGLQTAEDIPPLESETEEDDELPPLESETDEEYMSEVD